MTTNVKREVLQSASEEKFCRCPHFFQRNIKKSYELRIVVVDKDIYAFRIDSQDRESTSLDWRNEFHALNFTPIALPATVERQISSFMNQMGLFGGSFDLIVDEQGYYWFLEYNQDEQWSWLDPIVDGQISMAFARAFARRLRHELIRSDDNQPE